MAAILLAIKQRTKDVIKFFGKSLNYARFVLVN